MDRFPDERVQRPDHPLGQEARGRAQARSGSDGHACGSRASAMALNQWRLMAPALDVAHVQEAWPEAPGPVRPGQPFQQVCDEPVPGIAPRAVAKAGLADTRCPTGQRDADPLRRHCLPGRRAALSWPRHSFPRAPLSNSACRPKARRTPASTPGSRLQGTSSGSSSLAMVARTSRAIMARHPCRHVSSAICRCPPC